MASIQVSCRLTGARRNRIACTVKRRDAKRGAVRVRLSRGGRIVASGQATNAGSSATIRLRGSVRAGRRYVMTTTAPAGPATRRKVTHSIVLR